MMKTVRRLFAFALVLVCLGAACVLPAGAAIFIPQVDLKSEQEYNAFLEEAGELPDYFVTAEELLPFGSFLSLTSNYEHFARYRYALESQNGETVNITITNRSVDYHQIEEKGTLDSALIGADMRTLKEEASGTIVRQRVRYQYYGGALSSIKWMTEDYTFTLSQIDNFVGSSDLPEDALISRLLSTDQEAFASARQELVQISDGELTVKKTALQEFLTYDFPLTLLIVAGICLFFVIRKRKKTCRNHFFVPAT